ncbi:MAG: type II secretion system minor pseudopilin GspJ [Pseudomonadota bacterium]|nr:type II secretion system minor pseudopilin GspJ [Pseudomonadota bacterium]
MNHRRSTSSKPRSTFQRVVTDGFTLIEVLVALLILGIMSALGYGTYRTARISAERTEESLKRSREIEFGMRMLVQDFAQMVPRPVRDQLGQRAPALRGTSGAGTLSTSSTLSTSNVSGSSLNVTGSTASGNSTNSFGANAPSSSSVASIVDLTRGGWSNTAGQQRGTLQRVSYTLVDDVLKRSYQTSLDTVSGNKPVVQDLFTGVKAIQFRYLDSNQSWQSAWSVQSASADSGWTRPVAVEITIEFNDWGRVRRLIEVAG